MDINIKYLSDIYEKNPLQFVGGRGHSSWIDVRSAADICGKRGQHVLIPLGFAMALPEGYEALLAPRSSTFKKYGFIFTNAWGIIDTVYCGDNDEWMVSAYFLEDGTIQKGDRIAQFRIIESMPEVNFNVVETLGTKDRGGFGSTGNV